MSYSCLRHQYYSPKEPCGACSRERGMQAMGMAQSNQALMRANMQAQRWPQDVFERLEGERDVAVKMAATMQVMLIDLACWRNCPVCEQKIDRGYRPGTMSKTDGEDLWPYWHCHASDCDLRVTAERLNLPTAVANPSGSDE